MSFLFSTNHYLILEALYHFFIKFINSLSVGFFWLINSSTFKVNSKNSLDTPACLIITANAALTNLPAFSPPKLAHKHSFAN